MTGLHPRCAALPVVLAFGLGLAVPAAQPRIPVPTSSDRAFHLARHASEADLLRKAVIRGDLDAVREPARRLAEGAASPDMASANPKATDAMRQAARAAFEAPDVQRAADAAARLAAACGACHMASNVHSALPMTPTSTLGGVVGHMIEHQRAADELHAGLVEPSEPLWRRGAERLEGAPLKREKLPRDPQLTGAVVEAEARIHQLAARARQATTAEERTEIYAQVLGSCAACHSLHERIWGPGSLR